MSDYLDRLERELLSAGRLYQARPASRSFGSRRPRLGGSLAVIVSVMVTAGVVAIVLGTGLIHSGSPSITGHRARPTPTAPSGATATKVTAIGTCRQHPGGRLPPMVMSDAAPGGKLGAILSIARQPASEDGIGAIQGFDRYPLDVLTVFRRFIRIINGERGVRVAFFPVIFCQQTGSGRGFPPPRVRIAPAQAIAMLPLQGSQKTLAVDASIPSMILHGSALPGLDRPNNTGWIQAAIVPDGVAEVVMQFTPPFLHHYTVTAAVHDNVAVVVRKPDYSRDAPQRQDAGAVGPAGVAGRIALALPRSAQIDRLAGETAHDTEGQRVDVGPGMGRC